MSERDSRSHFKNKSISWSAPRDYLLVHWAIFSVSTSHSLSPHPQVNCGNTRAHTHKHTRGSELAKWRLTWLSLRTPDRSTQMWVSVGWREGREMRFPIHLLTFNEAQYLSRRLLWIIGIKSRCPGDTGLGTCPRKWPYHPTSGSHHNHVLSSA